ncbi:hypothetical protein CTU88_38075 [Streptomyces sp. JV178]|uniref:restriction endonuclease-related protein n=1 Tax=Streptomyces sp. JV178 TaxID=858632 RepID=UPI000C1B3552|nr:hypothetical protein [Streptomyces sp. JV178]PIM67305.1 hypothetical protein CTU88_38075 [Streptomyces sp. JV178]
MSEHGEAPTDQWQFDETVLRAASAFVLCEEARYNDGLSSGQRVEKLMEAQGVIMATVGPGHRVTFRDLLDRLSGAQAGSLVGIFPEEALTGPLRNLRFLDSVGVSTQEGCDLLWEAAEIFKIADKKQRRGERFTHFELESEFGQEQVFKAIKGGLYERHRRNIIEYPVCDKEQLEELGFPPAVAQVFYQDIPSYCLYKRQWWFGCPACAYPMQVIPHDDGRTYAVRCLYPWHQDTGARFSFTATRDQVPVLHAEDRIYIPSKAEMPLYTGASRETPRARPAEGYRALVRRVWRSTCIPGLPELRLADVLKEAAAGTRLTVKVWPDNDRVDIEVTDGDTVVFSIDVKDYTWPGTLAKKLIEDRGDKGGATWLVVPDHRRQQVGYLTSVIHRERIDMTVMAASDFLALFTDRLKEYM